MKKKILFFAVTPPPFHGSAYITESLINSNFAHEYNIKHINPRFANEIEEFQKITIKKSILFIKYYLVLVKQIYKFQPDYILMCPAFARNPFIKDFIYFFTSAILFHKRVIVWIHSNNIKMLYDSKNKLIKRAVKMMFENSYKIVPCSNKLSELNYNFFAKSENIIPIVNGIIVNINTDKNESPYITVTYLANMILAKGWKVLFDAANIICGEHQNLRFNFYGRYSFDNSQEYLDNIFSKSNYPDRIKYNGPVYGHEKERILAQSDIFCMPTFFITEAFPLSIIEAMAFGIPVITTDQGGITEAVIDGKGGLIVQKNSITDLVEKLNVLIKDSSLRKEMSNFNRDRYLKYYTKEIFVQNWINLFKYN